MELTKISVGMINMIRYLEGLLETIKGMKTDKRFGNWNVWDLFW